MRPAVNRLRRGRRKPEPTGGLTDGRGKIPQVKVRITQQNVLPGTGLFEPGGTPVFPYQLLQPRSVLRIHTNFTEVLQHHLSELKEQGYTVFPRFMSAQRVADLRSLLDPLFEKLFATKPDGSRRKIRPLLGHEVRGPACQDLALDPTMLSFAELAI